MRYLTVFAAVVATAGHIAAALGEEQIVTFPLLPPNYRPRGQAVFDASASAGAGAIHQQDFIIASKVHHHATPLLLDSRDNEAIHLAAQAFADDVHKVSGVKPKIYNDTLPKGVEEAIVVGSVKSKLITSVSGAADHLSSLEGKWESFDMRRVPKPLKGLKEGLVIAGSDRRGTVYALYTLSEQMGISPFHFWADVPIPHHPVVAIGSMPLSKGEPTVRYRGLFINDEHPALWGWAQEHFKLDYWEPAFQVEFHQHWFDMMLRLKANYFWPAMYASKFYVDGLDVSNGLPDPATPGPNHILANQMGIVMGTSHHEPMARNKPEWDWYGDGPWDWQKNNETLHEFWEYGAERAKGLETMFTMGMRGDGDEPLTGASNELVEHITSVQQDILRKVYGDDFAAVPQMWAMYKEVAGYYLNGLKVPEDSEITPFYTPLGDHLSANGAVITLFADDNYGNLMSVQPPDAEHKAGAGIYYHVDYVGAPRVYKWINTINLAKTWEQMNIARAFNTTQIWILNIGTLKPLETPTEWFMSLAWDFDKWERGSTKRFLELWAEREFGKHVAEETADIMWHYQMYAARHKTELLNTTTFSILHYEEAELVQHQWDTLAERAAKVYFSLPEKTQPAYYELVYMLCLMQANLNKLYISAGRSNLYAIQARTQTNIQSHAAIQAFYQDANLTESFHSLLDRKWDHILDQTHINFLEQLEPLRDTLPPITFVNPNQPSRAGIPIHERQTGHTAYIRVTVENSRGTWPGSHVYNCPFGRKCPDPTLLPMDPYGAKTRWVDIGSGGPKDVHFTIKSDDYIKVSQRKGRIMRDGSTDVRVYLSVLWDKLDGETEGHVLIQGDDRTNVTITIPISVPSAPAPDFHGYIEGDGAVSIETAHFTSNDSVGEYAWQEIPGYGRTLSGLSLFPVTAHNFTLGTGPVLTYTFWTHGGAGIRHVAPGGQALNPTAVAGAGGGTDATVILQLGTANNFIPYKLLSFGVQIDDASPILINPVPTEHQAVQGNNPDNTPVDWWSIVINEIRNVELKAQLQPGAHEIKIYGMSAGVVLERVVVDLGGVAARSGSYLGPPESVWV